RVGWSTRLQRWRTSLAIASRMAGGGVWWRAAVLDASAVRPADTTLRRGASVSGIFGTARKASSARATCDLPVKGDVRGRLSRQRSSVAMYQNGVDDLAFCAECYVECDGSMLNLHHVSLDLPEPRIPCVR